MRVFLYTLDQLTQILSIPEAQLMERYLFFQGRSVGIKKNDELLAVNIAPRHAPPEWRVSEKELLRWLAHKGFRVYETGAMVT